MRDDGLSEMHPPPSMPAKRGWFWTERWQRMEREAGEDIAAGRVRAYRDVDDLLAGLGRRDPTTVGRCNPCRGPA